MLQRPPEKELSKTDITRPTENTMPSLIQKIAEIPEQVASMGLFLVDRTELKVAQDLNALNSNLQMRVQNIADQMRNETQIFLNAYGFFGINQYIRPVQLTADLINASAEKLSLPDDEASILLRPFADRNLSFFF